MSIKLKPRRIIIIDSKSGGTNFEEILGRKPDVVDDRFAQFFGSVGERYITWGVAYAADTIIAIDDVMDLPHLDQSEANNLCAALSVMDDKGLLDIPEGKKEIEVVFGIATLDGVEFVLLVEREIKNNSDQIHLHARGLQDWKNDNSILLIRM